jgi:hypothetical protein
MQPTRLLILVAGAVVVIALFVVFRPDAEETAAESVPANVPELEPVATGATETRETETGADDGTETATETEETELEEPELPQPEPDPDEPVNVQIRVQDGRPEGGVRRPSVTLGRIVRIVVRSDVSDHVHVHGYDLMSDVGPNAPAVIRFRADIPGRFEIELEDRGLEIAELEVRP